MVDLGAILSSLFPWRVAEPQERSPHLLLPIRVTAYYPVRVSLPGYVKNQEKLYPPYQDSPNGSFVAPCSLAWSDDTYCNVYMICLPLPTSGLILRLSSGSLWCIQLPISLMHTGLHRILYLVRLVRSNVARCLKGMDRRPRIAYLLPLVHLPTLLCRIDIFGLYAVQRQHGAILGNADEVDIHPISSLSR